MKAYVLTRSHDYDYGFIQHEPPSLWWTTFNALTQFEHPTLLWKSNGGKWELFASAIRSSRHDRTGARIRFSIAAEGTRGDADDLRKIIAAWMQGAGMDSNPLARALDRAFPEDYCDGWLAARRSSSPRYDLDTRNVHERLEAAITELESVEASFRRLPSRWYGKFSPKFADDFCAHIDAVLSGREHGGAYVLTLVNPGEDDADLDRLHLGERVAILSKLADPTEPTRLPEVCSSTATSRDSHPDAPPKGDARPEGAILVLLVGTLLFLVALAGIWFLMTG